MGETGRDSRLSPQFMRKLTRALNNIKAIGYLSVMGGTFTLVYMLLSAYELGLGVLNMANVGYLAGGAVGFAIGIGLLTFSEPARAAGMMWFLAWGILNIVVGASAALRGDMMMGIFALTTGVAHVVFADLLHLPAEMFVTMVGGDLSPVMVEEGILKSQGDERNPTLREFVKKSQFGTD
ncbi:MAG: hypothetical protein ABFE07_22825 [Armatimonadia bacterium]